MEQRNPPPGGQARQGAGLDKSSRKAQRLAIALQSQVRRRGYKSLGAGDRLSTALIHEGVERDNIQGTPRASYLTPYAIITI